MAQLPSLVAGARSQRSLPFVPELRARSEFDSQEAFDQHRKERRKALWSASANLTGQSVFASEEQAAA